MVKKKQTAASAAAVQAAASKTVDSVIKEIASLKSAVGGALDDVGNMVASSLSALDNTQRAVDDKRAELAELHAIEATAETLVQLQDKMRAASDQFVSENEQRVQVRKREEDEYTYQLQRRHRADEDTWAAKLSAHEAKMAAERAELGKLATSLGERDALLKEFETECNHKVAESVKNSAAEVARACAALKKDLEHKHALELQELKNGLAISSQQYSSASSQVTALQQQVAKLEAELKAANERVQSIAQKAIEGAAAQKVTLQVPSAPEPARR